MSLFSGIRDAKVPKGGNYIQPGQFVFSIDALKLLESRKKEDLFISELEVVKSSNKVAHPVGSHTSWVVNFKHDAAMGNVKGFACAALSCDENEIDEEVMERLVDEEENPASGTLIFCEAANIKTREGNDFTLCKWSDYKEGVKGHDVLVADAGEETEEPAAPPEEKKAKKPLPGKGKK